MKANHAGDGSIFGMYSAEEGELATVLIHEPLREVLSRRAQTVRFCPEKNRKTGDPPTDPWKAKGKRKNDQSGTTSCQRLVAGATMRCGKKRQYAVLMLAK